MYALVAFPLGVIGFTFVIATLFFSVLLSVAGVGLVLLAVSSLGARQLGALNRALGRTLLDEEISAPPPFPPGAGVVGWVRSGIADRPGWRARAYLTCKFPLALVTFIAAIALRFGSLWWILAPAQWAAALGTETVRDDGTTRHFVINFGSFYFDTWPRALLLAVAGLAGWWLSPWVLRALLYLDRRLLADLLGLTSLPARVHQLERARADVVEDAASRLRHIERDLHDGAQAELVALSIKLGLAQAKLAQADPEGHADARMLVEDAQARAKTALRELRALARGMRPPELEGGLQAALSALAARSPIPTEDSVSLATRPSPAIEAIAYFCAAELLTNAAKHSSGSRAALRLAQEGDRLRLIVTDDGTGGAQSNPGGGLNGLAERLSTVDGTLGVRSPSGGPTVVIVELPVRP